MPCPLQPGSGVILASGSKYRRALLHRIVPEFSCAPPGIDEAQLMGETPAEMAARLARLKAEACRRSAPDALVIGSDQVPALGCAVLRKPGTRAKTIAQLRQCSGRAVRFFTGVCVVGPGGASSQSHVDVTTVRFRTLTLREIESYVDKEQPYDCAGGFKAEALGIALMEAIETADPTAIQGLPLIWLAACLSRLGVQVL
jgi:septum formation protein